MKSSTIARLKTLPREGKVYLGIDVSTSSWHVTARCAGETVFAASMPPQVGGLKGLLGSLQGREVASVYEAGPFGYGLHDWLRSQEVKSMVVAPSLIPTQAANRVKTDRRDSLKLATTLEAGMLRPIYVPEVEHRGYRELVRQRLRLQEHRRKSMQRLKAFFLTYGVELPPGQHWRGDFDGWLKELTLEGPYLQKTLETARELYFELTRRVRALDVDLRELAWSKAFASWTRLFTSVPGIAEQSALILSVEVMDWSRFESGEELSAYVGLTPSEYSSGQTIRHGRITRLGNAILRNLLVEASWNLIRADRGMRTFYEAIKTRRGSKRAIVAVARKLCHRLVAMAKTGQTYRMIPMKSTEAHRIVATKV